MSDDLVERRRYARNDIEAILGRALATRDEQEVPSGGLAPDAARQTVIELGRTFGLPEEAVLAAFAAEAEEFRLGQRWVESLGATPSVLAIVRHLVNGVGRAAPELVVRQNHLDWVVDQQAHQASRLVHAAEVAALGLLAMGNTPSGGTVPAIRVTLHRVVRPAVRFLGFALYGPLMRRTAALTFVQLPTGIMVEGEIDDRDMAALVGPLLAELETRLGDRFEIGRMVVHELG